MLGGVFYSCASGNGRMAQGDKAPTQTALTVAGTPVPADAIRLGVEGQMGQFGGDGIDPQFELTLYSQVMNQLVDTAAYEQLAKQNGVDLSDANLLKAFETDFQSRMEQARESAAMSGQLKPGYTEKDWLDFVKTQTGGKTLDELKNSQLEDLKKRLADASTHQSVVITLAPAALRAALAPKFQPTDDQLKQSYSTVTYKRILFKNDLPGKSAEERANTVLAELKSGLKFETAIDRYTNDLPLGGTKVSEPTNSATGSSILGDPQYKPLQGLKKDEITGVVDLPEGKAIYKVFSVQPNLPKDFEEKKAQYRAKLSRDLVEADIARQLADLKKSPELVVYKAPGFKAVADAADLARSAGDLNKLKKVYEEAKQAVAKNEGYDARAAALAQFVAFDGIWKAPDADQKKLLPERVQVIDDLLKTRESFKLRMELVDLFDKDGKPDQVFENLLQAAQSNTMPDGTGQSNFGTIAAKVADLRSRRVITEEQEKQIQVEQDRWRNDKIEADKFQAEQKVQEAAAKKQAEEEEKKAKAEKPADKPVDKKP